MTTGDDLGKCDVFVKLAVTLFLQAEEAVRQGMTMKVFERGYSEVCSVPEGVRFTNSLSLRETENSAR